MNIFITDDDYKRAKANGVCKNTLNNRVRKLKWDKERAITTSVIKVKSFKETIRENYPGIFELCEQNEICYNTFRTRVLRRKWDVYNAATTPVDKRFSNS